MKPFPNITAVIRDVLLTVSDPDTQTIARLTELVRAKYAHVGGNPNDVKPHQISQTRQKVRDFAKGPCTQEAVRKMIAKLNGATIAYPRHQASAAQVKMPQAASVQVDDLHKAADFIRAVGGIGKAKSLVSILEAVL